jgi:hypothetical protein
VQQGAEDEPVGLSRGAASLCCLQHVKGVGQGGVRVTAVNKAVAQLQSLLHSHAATLASAKPPGPLCDLALAECEALVGAHGLVMLKHAALLFIHAKVILGLAYN